MTFSVSEIKTLGKLLLKYGIAFGIIAIVLYALAIPTVERQSAPITPGAPPVQVVVQVQAAPPAPPPVVRVGDRFRASTDVVELGGCRVDKRQDAMLVVAVEGQVATVQYAPERPVLDDLDDECPVGKTHVVPLHMLGTWRDWARADHLKGIP